MNENIYKRFMDDTVDTYNTSYVNYSTYYVDQNNAMDRIKEVLTVKEFDILNGTNFMSSGDRINEFILIIQKLMAQGIIGKNDTKPEPAVPAYPYGGVTPPPVYYSGTPFSPYYAGDMPLKAVKDLINGNIVEPPTSDDGDEEDDEDRPYTPLENLDTFIGYIDTDVISHPNIADVKLIGVEDKTIHAKDGDFGNYHYADVKFENGIWKVIGARYLGETTTNVESRSLSYVIGKNTNEPMYAGVGDTVDYNNSRYTFTGKHWVKIY